jgi:hypothetical protein
MLVAACGNFQDPDIVIDLRVLSITSSPANQVVDITASSQPADILAQLVPTTVCALTSDPSFDGGLDWSMTLCNTATDDRCADNSNGSDVSPTYVIGSGTIADPDTTSPEPQLCGTIPADENLANVLINSIQTDPLMGLGGVNYSIVLEVGDVGVDVSQDQFAEKELQVIPRIPANVTQNHNPDLRRADDHRRLADLHRSDLVPMECRQRQLLERFDRWAGRSVRQHSAALHRLERARLGHDLAGHRRAVVPHPARRSARRGVVRVVYSSDAVNH